MADDTTRARLFETELHRLLSAYENIKDWDEWWEREMESVKKLLEDYGVKQ